MTGSDGDGIDTAPATGEVGGRLATVDAPTAAVFASGVASMGLEILAGRILAPQFGSSIYTWGSVIGVFLAALSLGYHHGGRRAARRASVRRLAWLSLGTAAYVAVVVFAHDYLVRAAATVPLPPRFASLPAVTLLFGPPTYLLGFVSPYAAELSAETGVGAASGRVYAVGTVGSIVGAFGTTFLLVPALSIPETGAVLGGLLVAVAAGIAVLGGGETGSSGDGPSGSPGDEADSAPGGSGGADSASGSDSDARGAADATGGPTVDVDVDRDLGAAVLVVALLLTGAVGSGVVGVSTGGEVLYATQTDYQELRVAQLGDTRTLYLDGQRHSAMDVDDPTRHVFTYTRYFHLPYLFVDDPDRIDRVLFVGGGGFTGPKRFLAEYPNVTVDVVEHDPAVVRVAREYFGVEDHPRLNVHVGDGRRYLRETDRRYDVVVLDAYQKDKVPFHLTTVEFAELVERRLTDDGVVVANVISAPTGPASKFYRAQYRTFDRAFPRVYAFPTVGGSAVQNVELVATVDDRRLSQATLRARNDRRSIGIDLSRAVDNYRVEGDLSGAPVLRDDDAPVDRLTDPLVGQEYVIQRAPESVDGEATTATPTPTAAPNRTAADGTAAD